MNRNKEYWKPPKLKRKKKKKILKNEGRLRDLSDNIKCPNILTVGVPEGGERERGRRRERERQETYLKK